MSKTCQNKSELYDPPINDLIYVNHPFIAHSNNTITSPDTFSPCDLSTKVTLITRILLQQFTT